MRLLSLALLAGCAVDGGSWDGVPIERAWLERFDLSSLNVVFGAAQGDAILGFETPGGRVDGVPVHLGGGSMGLALDLSVDPEGHDGSVDVDLTDVETPTVGDVFGTYHGTAASAAAGIGGGGRRLRNGHGASFREEHFQLGIGVFAGYEWIVIREGGSDGAEVTPTDRNDATGGTGDTGAPPTTTTPPTTTPPTTTGTTTPTAGTTTGTGGDGCGGDGSGCGGGGGSGCACDDDSGCACAHGSLAPVGAVWMGVLLRRRRRHAQAR